jgi:trimeric autotransporter adhesin
LREVEFMPRLSPSNRLRRILVTRAAGLATVLAAAVAVTPAVASAAATPGYRLVSDSSRLVTDTMSRTVERGWGSADVGGRYEVSSDKAASVEPGAARLDLADPGSSAVAMLPDTSGSDVESALTVSVPHIPPTGTGVYAAVMVRASAPRNAYRARLRVLPGGGVRLSFSRVNAGAETLFGGETELPTRLPEGAQLVLQTRVTGTDPVTLASRAWLVGAPVPTQWQHTATDSSDQRVTSPGSLGVWTYLSRQGTPASVIVGGFTVDSVSGQPTTNAPAPAAGSTASPTASPAPSGSATPSAEVSPDTSPDVSPTASPTAAPGADVPGAVTTTAADPQPSGSPSTDGSGDRKAAKAGSAPIGSTAYPVPAKAIVVAPDGSDSAAGTVSAPLRTVAQAIDSAPAEGTIVLRAGTYHESVTVPATKTLTIQAYPHEAVWFDGSSPVSGWKSDAGDWYHDGWSAQFDSSPTYTAGAAVSSNTAFQFVDPKYPMAAHPDQLWIGGAAQRQVGSRAEVTPGTFFADYAAHRLYLGSDPSGQQVRATDLAEAITIRSGGSVLRGIGVRRYATSLPKMATVKVVAGNVTVENLTVTDSATTGLSALANHITFKHVTSSDNGMLGIHANYADDLRMESVLSENNNLEHFKSAPVAGGIKVTRSRRVAIVNSRLHANLGTGIWMDESVYGITLTGNDIVDNTHHGISLELSAKALVADNVITGNRDDGIRVNDTAGVQIWNNTLSGNTRTINLVQDGRRAANLSTPGHDPRQKLPDPTVTWLLGQIDASNNVLSHVRSGATCLLCAEDYSHERSAAQMQIDVDGNVYTRPDTSTPTWVIVWSRGPGNPATYTGVDAFRSATGQEAHGLGFDGATAARSDGTPGASVEAQAATAARPLPDTIATALGRDTGVRHLGAWT